MAAIVLLTRALEMGVRVNFKDLHPACIDPLIGRRAREILAPRVGGDLVDLSTQPLRVIVAAYNERR